MDLLILRVLIFIIFACIILILSLGIMYLISRFSKKNVKMSYEFFKKLIYAVFTGVIVAIILDFKNQSMFDLKFWIINIPVATLMISAFSLLGLLYLKGLHKIYFKPIKLNSNDSNEKMMDQKSKVSLQEYLKIYQYNLLTLSVFIVITLTLPVGGYSLILAILSAFIAYILLISILSPLKRGDEIYLYTFKILLALFTTGFCGGVITNLILKLQDISILIVGGIWLILMILPGIRLFPTKHRE